MVVKCGDQKSVSKCNIHRRAHLILEDNRVAHDHRSILGRHECRPRAEPRGRWERHTVHLDQHVIPRPADAHYPVGGHARLGSRGFFDDAGVQRGVRFLLMAFLPTGCKAEQEGGSDNDGRPRQQTHAK